MTVCFICNADIEPSTTPSSCVVCLSLYHPDCVKRSVNGNIINCIECKKHGVNSNRLKVPEPPKSRRSKSKLGSVKSTTSDNALELKMLEDQLQMERRQNAEKLELLERSHIRENQLMEKKIALLRDSSSSGSSKSVFSKDEENTTKKVENWRQETKSPPEQHSRPTKNPISSTFINSHEVLSPGKNCTISRVPIKDLPSFSGDPLEWPVFLSSYESSTKVYDIQHEENLIRLQNSLKGDALRAVKGTLIFPERVPDAINRLKQLFGRPDYIINKIQTKIMEFSCPKMDKFNSIIEFATYVESILTMQQAKLSDHLRNPGLLQTIVQKLPVQMQLDWAKHRLHFEDTAVNLELLNDWLTERSMECCSLLTAPPSFKGALNNDQKPRSYVNVHEGKSICVVCEGNCSSAADCTKFINMSYKERWSVVNIRSDKQSRSLCRHCLKPHKGRCFSKAQCGINGCSIKHHKMLHKFMDSGSEEQSTGLVLEPGKVVATHIQRRNQTYFKIVPISLRNGNRTVQTYALLDDGSQVTLAEKWIFEELGLKGTHRPLTLKWTGNEHRNEDDSILFSVTAFGPNSKLKLQNVHTVQTLDLPSQTIDVTDLQDTYEHLQDLPLLGYDNAKPKILIGLDNAHLLIVSNVREGKYGEPIAAKSKLGWIIFGNDGFESEQSKHNFHFCECHQDEASLNDLVRDYIAFDNLYTTGTKRNWLTIEEKKAVNIMEKTIKFVDGKYEIGLLWRFQDFNFPNSYPMAVKRLECLEKQMKIDPNLREEFSNQIRSYLLKGYAKKVTFDEESSSSCWYLPMFLVKNANKPNKIRPVWDAAASVRGVSLNSALLAGPDQMAKLPGILCRFRQFRIGISADVKEMFHQIKIRPEDQQYQRFLWRESPDMEPEIYVMSVMTFGAKCSPSCSQFVKNYNAQLYADRFPRAVESIVSNHYVDDMLDSVENETDGETLIKDVRHIHEAGGFEIRGWLSNSSNILDSIPDSSFSNNKSLSMDIDTPGDKVLGMWWNTSTDNFTFSLKYSKATSDVLNGKTVPTKRQVLQVLASIYDPLGFLSHFLIYPKIIMQDIWRSGIGWNDEIDESIFCRWSTWISSLKEIESLKIPRWYGYSTSINDPELHVFVDASLEAYAAVCYLRFQNGQEVICRLVMAKSKVCPLKAITVPRLELNAAVLGTKLAEAVKSYHTLKIGRTIFWTDSKTVWSWVRSESKSFQQYVAFRISEIHESTLPSQWRWLESKLNIADVATRCKIPKLSSDTEWFLGPKFLYENENLWPKQLIHEKTLEEIKTSSIVFVCAHQIMEVERFSCWRRLRRTQAFVNRFAYNLLAKVRKLPLRSGILSRGEYIQAENMLYKQAQEETYKSDYMVLLEKRELPKNNPLKKYIPYADDCGVIKCLGRIDVAESALDCTKRPILLPGQHYITKLILKHFHELYLHIHHETAITSILQKFEVPKIRVEMGKIKTSCQRCKNLKAKPLTPVMANLPSARLSTFTRPFSFVGIDFFGPLQIVSGRKTLKRWGVMITCLSVRAIHLEISPSLSTESCVLALKRFISRRGTPIEIYSDQGTNFKGARNELKEVMRAIDQKELAQNFVSSTTEWFFNPPASPHMGGAWERLIRTVKDAIYMTYPRRKPTEELLLTMLCEIECMVNSRPLTFLPISSEQGEVITPNHFLLGSANGNKPIGILTSDKDVLLNNWKKSQQFSDRFHKHFTKAYLPVLRRRTKWFDNVEDLKVGDIVLVVEENTRPADWKKAKIIGVKASRDGHVRQATIQNMYGTYERPAVKLAKLDVENCGRSPDCAESIEIPGGSVTSNNPV